MKFRKSRHFRRLINFYTIQFGYHEPAFILLDGNFLKICIEKQMDIQYLFTKYSHLKCIPKITQCVMNELNQLKSIFPGVYQAAQKYQILRCGHFQGVLPNQCIMDIVKDIPAHGGSNQYYWVFTQDEVLQRQLYKLVHVPVGFIQAKGNALTMQEPSEDSRKHIQDDERAKYLPAIHEYKIITPLQREERRKNFQNSLEKAKKQRSQLQLKIKKPALGPNPLSTKKKQQASQFINASKKIKKRRHKQKNRKKKVKQLKE